jgi:hypothetical protein
MPDPLLSPEDCPPPRTTRVDRMLQRQLENSLDKHFYQAGDRLIQSLLSRCEWYITTNATALTLVIACPDPLTNWKVLHHIVKIGRKLEAFSDSAKIRVCPPTGTGTPFEIRVDELSVYQDSL